MIGIQMVDLRTQYHRIQQEIDKAILDVVESSAFINGPAVKQFAQNLAKYLNVKHVIPCANGTDALQISMMALGLQPGDEVITPSFSYIAAAETIAILRLKPVFVDSDPDTFNINIDSLKKAITPRTKAIIPVHLFGQVCDMQPILEISQQYNIPVIEDTAQAIGAIYTFPDGTQKKAGTMGIIGTTSFFPSKNLGCYGDGGAMFTNDDAIAEKLRMIANHGSKVRYYHEMVGMNSRLDSIQAAVLDVKLKYLDNYIQARRQAADKYDNLLKNVDEVITPYRAPYGYHVFHQYTLRLKKQNNHQVQKKLAEKNIPSMIYYPVVGHKQNMFADYHHLHLPVAEQLQKEVLSLPMHTELTDEQIYYIVDNLKDAVCS
ncbi:MAG: DegT/DnrJ/EryC1/StrS family aminotransferase [Bacteroidia bacterium]|nr:DegT/DnrJ/EryC1/StrS family aminotransferase [Bacteroidia bacterium]MDW8302659.1 DegT/DnrJ/EryC1/StrS family aminotransferase [Bacteroidia bacterium]